MMSTETQHNLLSADGPQHSYHIDPIGIDLAQPIPAVLHADKARSSSMAYVQLFQTAREQLRTARISAERFRYLSGHLDDKMAQVQLAHAGMLP